MTTQADIGYGGLLAVETTVGSGTYTALGEVTSITPPNESVDVIDATHMGSPNRTREFIQGLIDPGDASADLNWVPGAATEDFILAWRTAGETRSVRITAPNNTTYTFPGFVTGFSPTMPMDGKMTATLTLKVAGAVVVGTAS